MVAPAGIAIDAGEAVMRITLDKALDNPLPCGAPQSLAASRSSLVQ